MPDAPTNLTNDSKSHEEVVISWDAVVFDGGVSEYEVFRDSISSGVTSSLTYTDSNVDASTTYLYTITTKGLDGSVSEKSVELSVTTDATPVIPDPDAPTNLLEGVVDDTSIELNWDAVDYSPHSTIASYDIYEGGSMAYSSVTNSYTVTGLTTGTLYKFTVVAVGDNGQNSIASNEILVTTT